MSLLSSDVSTRRRLLICLLLVLGGSAGCKSTPDDTVPALPSCDEPTPLLPLHETWENGDESCRSWIELTRGRLAHNSVGSAVVWTRNVPSGVGLVLGAFHVLGPGWFQSFLNVEAGEDVPEALRAPPRDEHGIMRLRFPPVDGSWDRSDISGLWMLYNPAIPAAEHEDVTQVLPRSDFFVGLSDGRRVAEGLTGAPSHTLDLSVEMPLYDPQGLTKTEALFAEAEPNTRVLLAGYPQAGPALGAFSVGRVLGDAEAEEVIVSLSAVGDEEGEIPYEASLEFLVEGRAEPGMSGGGVFDPEGNLLGVMVRASTADIGTQYVRVVRLSWIAQRFEAIAASLDPAERAEVEDFLPF